MIAQHAARHDETPHHDDGSIVIYPPTPIESKAVEAERKASVA